MYAACLASSSAVPSVVGTPYSESQTSLLPIKAWMSLIWL